MIVWFTYLLPTDILNWPHYYYFLPLLAGAITSCWTRWNASVAWTEWPPLTPTRFSVLHSTSFFGSHWITFKQPCFSPFIPSASQWNLFFIRCRQTGNRNAKTSVLWFGARWLGLGDSSCWVSISWETKSPRWTLSSSPSGPRTFCSLATFTICSLLHSRCLTFIGSTKEAR